MKMNKRYTGFKTYQEAKQHADDLKDCVVVGFGWSKENKHFFEVEVLENDI